MGLSSNFNCNAKEHKNEIYTEFDINEEDTVVFVWHKIKNKEDCLTFSVEQADVELRGDDPFLAQLAEKIPV